MCTTKKNHFTSPSPPYRQTWQFTLHHKCGLVLATLLCSLMLGCHWYTVCLYCPCPTDHLCFGIYYNSLFCLPYSSVIAYLLFTVYASVCVLVHMTWTESKQFHVVFVTDSNRKENNFLNAINNLLTGPIGLAGS